MKEKLINFVERNLANAANFNDLELRRSFRDFAYGAVLFYVETTCMDDVASVIELENKWNCEWRTKFDKLIYADFEEEEEK